MKMSNLLQEEPTIAGVNIVPVIDLCLVLLIVLMVTSPLLDTADLKVSLPQASTIESKERNISITYTPEGKMAVNTEVIPAEQLVQKLQPMIARQKDILVILRVDKTVSYGKLTELIAQCKQAGATNISIGTEQKKING